MSSVTIEGFDDVLHERLQSRQNILLLGAPFSGKTTLAIQFLTTGLRCGEGAILVTTTDTPEGYRIKARAFGWDLKEYEDQGKLAYIDCYSPQVGISLDRSDAIFRTGLGEGSLEKISLIVSALISDFWRDGRKVRLVFDNLSTLLYYNDLMPIARFLHTLLGRLKAAGATSILILESGVHDERVTTVLRSLCDGVLQISGDGEKRYIQGILSAGSLGRLPIEISDCGLRLASPPTNPAT